MSVGATDQFLRFWDSLRGTLLFSLPISAPEGVTSLASFTAPTPLDALSASHTFDASTSTSSPHEHTVAMPVSHRDALYVAIGTRDGYVTLWDMGERTIVAMVCHSLSHAAVTNVSVCLAHPSSLPLQSLLPAFPLAAHAVPVVAVTSSDQVTTMYALMQLPPLATPTGRGDADAAQRVLRLVLTPMHEAVMAAGAATVSDGGIWTGR